MRKCAAKEALNKLLYGPTKSAQILKNYLDRHSSITMADCLAKLEKIENLSLQEILTVHDVINDNLDNKITFMT